MLSEGPPLAPAPRLEVLSTTSLKVSWDEPFTWDLLPVLSYQLTVSSGTATNTYSLSGNETSHIITRERETTVCSELWFEVTARNEEGESGPGTTSGGYPVGKSS